jgi:NAD(P)-dependent dehydrogenase (short-subunit alcohol dehydrogenase family)
LRSGAKRVYAGTRRPLDHWAGRVRPLTLDMTGEEQAQTAVDEIESVDIVINNAGIAHDDDLSDRSVPERRLAVNLVGTYRVTQAFRPLLTDPRGAISQQSVPERRGLVPHSP